MPTTTALDKLIKTLNGSAYQTSASQWPRPAGWTLTPPHSAAASSARCEEIPMKPSIELQVLRFVANAFMDHLEASLLTIDDPASAYFGDADMSELELRLGRIVKRAELMRATSLCRKAMDKVVIAALDDLRASLNAALMKIADDGEDL
jgi:hypothetical protein